MSHDDPLASDALVIVAHPDDEALWFSSQLRRAKHIVITYLDEAGLAPAIADGRRRARDAFPLDNVSWLEVRGAGALDEGRWSAPLGEHGMRLRSEAARARYAEAFAAILEPLRALVELHQPRRLITHSPWGEYGHEDHVQVHVAARTIADTTGSELWVPLYCSAKSMPRLERYACGSHSARCRSFTTDTDIAHRLRDLYVDAGCWTWPRRYTWFTEESFLHLDDARGKFGTLPLNFVKLPGF